MAEITYREAISGVLREYLEKDDRVFLMGEDIGAYGGSYAVTRGFLERYGED
ncbi:MAG: alpha-ketoacid dehydrogenase subunit beta, partial [Chloroflexi bacterium]|nr:alpha-ketoacid dehydrogenase subunit beta [Chloroflexota bacterium]